MKIGILGSGNVGGTLGTKWARAGHQVVFSSRDPGSVQMRELIGRAGASARAAGLSETAASAEVILLSPPWPATRAILAAAGDLSGKVLIDVTNPVLPDFSRLEIGNTTSAGEMVAGWAPGARVVKAFNTVGYAVMADPSVSGEKVALLYCGDDLSAKAVVSQLATELGFNAIDAGPLTQARLLEPLALLWITMAIKQGFGFHWGFKILS